MAEVSWIKLSLAMFDDDKIKIIESLPESDAILIIWIKLLTLAGKTNEGGLIYLSKHMAYTPETLSILFKKPLSVVQLALTTLNQFGMIETFETGEIEIVNWEKHQNVDGMERAKKLNAERNKRYRERKKIGITEPEVNGATSPVTSHDATDIDKDIDKDIRDIKPLSNDLDESGSNESPKISKSQELETNFDKLWNIYPKKQGRAKALDAYKKAIKAGTTNREIQVGIVEYVKYINANRKQNFIAMGSTWFNQQRWQDKFTDDELAGKSANDWTNKKKVETVPTYDVPASADKSPDEIAAKKVAAEERMKRLRESRNTGA